MTASDPEGKPLSYTWNVPGHTVVGNGASVTLTASQVEKTQHSTGKVTVSDGVNEVTRIFNITVNDTTSTDPVEPPTEPGKTTWDVNAVYVGGDVVWYQGVQYKASWWTRGALPSKGGVWQEIIPDDGTVRAWRSDLVYTGGDKVTFSGETYQARWWTRGQQPDTNSVWRKL